MKEAEKRMEVERQEEEERKKREETMRSFPVPHQIQSLHPDHSTLYLRQSHHSIHSLLLESFHHPNPSLLSHSTHPRHNLYRSPQFIHHGVQPLSHLNLLSPHYHSVSLMTRTSTRLMLRSRLTQSLLRFLHSSLLSNGSPIHLDQKKRYSRNWTKIRQNKCKK